MQQKVTSADKVTSYEISKRLHELGYDGESHCGWWIKDCSCHGWHWSKYIGSNFTESIKAYDCWDLLMWSFKHCGVEFNPCIYNAGNKVRAKLFTVPLRREGENDQPQDALGLAIIKILEEQNDT